MAGEGSAGTVSGGAPSVWGANAPGSTLALGGGGGMAACTSASAAAWSSALKASAGADTFTVSH